MSLPPLPAGLKLDSSSRDDTPAPPRRRRDKPRETVRLRTGETVRLDPPTGDAHDGDTFRLRSGENARLFGVDAFELDQTGRARDGGTVPLGAEARRRLLAFAQPDATVTGTGDKTYGRPVATLERDGDAATALLDAGLGIATPEYLRGNDDARTRYMEAERLARLNRRGAWQTQFKQPSSYRHGTPDPWAKAEYSSTPVAGGSAVFWDEPTPMQGLRPEIERGYVAIWQDRKSKPEDLLAYAKASGFTVDPEQTRRRYAQRDKGARAGSQVGYAKPPRVLTDPKDGVLGSAARGFADPINMLDEMGAVVDTLGGTDGRENLLNSDRRFGDILANNLDQNRSILAFDEAYHPVARVGGQLAGGLVVPGGSVEGLAAASARNALEAGAGRFAAEQIGRRAVVNRLAGVGAAEGAAAGVGQGETWQERVQGGLIGAPAGAVLGAGTGLLLPKVAAAGRRIIDFSSDRLPTAARRAIRQRRGLDPAEGRFGTIHYNLAAPKRWSRALKRLREDDAGEIPSAIHHPEIGNVDVVWGNEQVGLKRVADEEPAALDRLPREIERLPVVTRPEEGGSGSFILEDATHRAVISPDVDGNTRRWVVASYGRKLVDHEGAEMPPGSLAPDGDPTGVAAEPDTLAPVPTSTSVPSRREQAVQNLTSRIDAEVVARRATRASPAEPNPNGAEADGGRAVPILSDATDATRAAQAERIAPTDVLPLPENTVSSMEEAESIGASQVVRSPLDEPGSGGDPLYQDRGQPVSMDDLDRNSPPVDAYQEWGDAPPNFAGNLRLDKLDSPEAIERALVATHDRVGGFDAATRGRITHAETERLASEMGMTADVLLKRRKGQAFNAEEALAARQILARSATDLVDMARRMQRVDNPGEELEAAFKGAWLRHVAIQEQVAGATAEAGRALQAFRVVADARAVDRVLPSLGDIAGGATRLRDVADKLVDLELTGVGPGGVNSFAAKALKPRFRDKLVELYYNSLLSGPQTHAVNILSNTLTALGQIPEHAVAASVGAARKALPGQAATDRVLFSELGARGVGLIQGTREGLRQAARTFITGDAADAVTKVEQQTQRAISGVKGSIIRTPTRGLAAEDELFKAMARRMELSGLAVREAAKEGLRGKAARTRAADLLANPTDDMLARSFSYGRYLTFQSPLGDAGRHISAITEAMPILKLILPFIRTPTNILKFAIERSPAAPLLKEWRRDIVVGGAKRDLAIAKVMVGTGIGASIIQLAANGHITGGGPADDSAKRLLAANGWQPYSFKVGDKYYSYARLDPYSTTLGTAADLVDLRSHMTEKQREKSLLLLGTAILHNLANKTWLSGLSTALEALNDPDRSLESFVSRTAGAIVVPAIVAQSARLADPVMREARAPIDRIRSRLPGASQSLPPRRDVFGKGMVSEGGLGPDIIAPIYTTTGKNDPTVAALLAAEIRIGLPSRKVGKRELTPAEYSEYQRVAGGIAKPRLDVLVGDPTWKALGDEDQQDVIDKLMKKARAEARGQLFTPATAPAGSTTSAAATPALPPGLILGSKPTRRSRRSRAMPPLPEGLILSSQAR